MPPREAVPAARRCARRRLLILVGAVALASAVSSLFAVAAEVSSAGQLLERGAAESLVLHLAVSTALAAFLLAVRHTLLAAGRGRWATALPAAAAALPAVATAASVAARWIEGGVEAADVLWVAGLPGWAGLAAVGAAAWLRPAEPGMPWSFRAGRTATVLLGGWGGTAALQAWFGPDSGSPPGAGWPDLVREASWGHAGGGDAAVALALMATAALAVTAGLPALTRWRLALAPAVAVTVLVAVPDVLTAGLARTWEPLRAGTQVWLTLPATLCLVGAAAGMLLASALRPAGAATARGAGAVRAG